MSVTFLNATTGWAVGSGGTILKIEVPDATNIMKAETLKNYKKALEDIDRAENIDLRVFLTDVETVSAEIDRLNKEQKKLEKTVDAAKNNSKSDDSENKDTSNTESIWLNLQTRMDDNTFISSTLTRIGVVGFIIYFIGIFSNLHRYSLRLAAFYDARADVLELKQPDSTEFAVLIDNFSPDHLNFGKPTQNPASQAIDLAKELLKVKK